MSRTDPYGQIRSQWQMTGARGDDSMFSGISPSSPRARAAPPLDQTARMERVRNWFATRNRPSN